MFDGTFATGLGLTVMVYVTGFPAHPNKVGVTVIVPVIAAPVALVALKAGTFPVPAPPNPIEVLLLVHVNVAPTGVLVKFPTGTASPDQ